MWEGIMAIDIGQLDGCTYCLNLHDGSVNYIRAMLRMNELLPIPDYNYGYYYAGPSHYTEREAGASQYYQIFVTHSGRGKFILDGREYIAEPNTIAMLDLSTPHRYETLGDNWEYEWVNFSGPSCPFYYSRINPNGFYIYNLMDNASLKETLAGIRELVTGVSEIKYAQIGVRILNLMDELMTFTSDYLQQKQVFKRQDNIQAAIVYMNEHYAETVSLEALCEVAFLSKYYFIRAFTNYTGMTPYKYLTSIRLTQARQQLLFSSLSVEEISWRVGFGNSKNFIRTFKHATGYTPEYYRREMSKKSI